MHPFHGQGEKDMKVEKILRDQSGTVLVIALMMMVIFTLIVISASSTAIIESRLSGNKRMSTAAFYAADSGLHVAAANIENFAMEDKYVNNKYNIFTDPANPNPTNAKVVIEHDAIQAGAPRGTGMSAVNFEFEHFVIASTGQDSTEPGLSKSTCTVEEKVVRLGPTLQGGY
jgi:Tfp pilus assembly protein PilX